MRIRKEIVPFVNRIRKLKRNGLKTLWKDIVEDKAKGWPNGRALEYLILRAFELEGAVIRWPYHVYINNLLVEEIDGAVHLKELNLSILIECKDHATNLNIGSIAKLRNQLMRRSSNAVGAVFTTAGFTDPALILAQFVAPQTIVLWERNHIEYSLFNGSFSKDFLRKYQHLIEEGFPNYDITLTEKLK